MSDLPPLYQSSPPVFQSALAPLLRAGETDELLGLVRRLRRGSAIRVIADDALNGRPLRPGDANIIIETAENQRRTGWRERAAAILLIGKVREWHPEHRERAASALAGLLRAPQYTAPGCIYALGIYFLHTFFIAYALWADSRANRLRAMAAASLGPLRVPDSVSALAKAVYDRKSFWRSIGVRKVRRAAVAALPEALTSLTPDQYARLPFDTVPNLCRLLRHANEPLILAALEALANVGGGSAIRLVERAARKGRTAAIREAAERVLPRIQERRQQELNPQRLLRPADTPGRADSVLLRPATGAPAGEEALLHRPSVAEEGA